VNKTLIAKQSVVINAPLSKVWDALVNPVLIKQYLFGTEAVSDWKAGSSIVFTGTWKGKAYVHKGVVLRMEPGKILQHTNWSSLSGIPDVPENYYIVTYELSTINSQTLLSVTQDRIATEEERVGSEKNWQGVLSTLKNLLEA
jgi:uncharacterized protein YndB with AHSA1/START domain